MTDDSHMLVLNGESLRPGIDSLQLGVTHESLIRDLAGSTHWRNLVCKTGKTALRSKGRLFQTERCSMDAQGTVMLQEWHVSKLDAVLIDQQLVRIDVALTGTGNKDLSALLEDKYGHAGITLPEKENPGYKTAMLWQHRDDQIRLYPGKSLQFIDGRLEESLPALYAFMPPFGTD